MLNFEEELKKFQPSLDVEEIEDAVYQEDVYKRQVSGHGSKALSEGAGLSG